MSGSLPLPIIYYNNQEKLFTLLLKIEKGANSIHETFSFSVAGNMIKAEAQSIFHSLYMENVPLGSQGLPGMRINSEPIQRKDADLLSGMGGCLYWVKRRTLQLRLQQGIHINVNIKSKGQFLGILLLNPCFDCERMCIHKSNMYISFFLWKIIYINGYKVVWKELCLFEIIGTFSFDCFFCNEWLL